jgi:hypothetical protein
MGRAKRSINRAFKTAGQASQGLDQDRELKSLTRSSRIRPANDQDTSRNDRNGWSIESAGQEPDSANAAGSEIGPENTLKVETRVQIPLGLPRSEVVFGFLNSQAGAGLGASPQREPPSNSSIFAAASFFNSSATFW